jgi:putative hydrolase of the HAD superfamily
MAKMYLTFKDPTMLAKFSYILFFIFCLSGLSNPIQAAQQGKIKVVVFDFGGVIAKSDYHELANFIAKSLGISQEEALEEIAKFKKQETQGVKELDFWLDFANSNNIKLPNDWLDQLNAARLHSIKVIPGMIELVKDLQKQGFQTALLSNVRESQAQIKRKLGYYELFDPALLSYEIGVKKPDPKAFYILLDRLKTSPDTVLFIDNKPLNIETAKSLGMDVIQFINTNQLIEELKQRGIEISLPTQSTTSIRE